MAVFTNTNAQYYLVVGLLQDAKSYSMDRCLERDMLAVVSTEPPVRFSTKNDVHSLAALVLRAFSKAGIEVVESLGDESDFIDADKEQVVKDLFALHAQIKDFMSMTWGSEASQQSALDELKGAALAAAVHSKTCLRSSVARRVFVNV